MLFFLPRENIYEIPRTGCSQDWEFLIFNKFSRAQMGFYELKKQNRITFLRSNTDGKMRKIMFIGCNSYVGKQIIPEFSEAFELIGTYHKKKNDYLRVQVQLDATDRSAVESVIQKYVPDIIVILSAVSSTSDKRAGGINVRIVSNIFDAVSNSGIRPKIIMFSSDQVFSGRCGPYTESDKPDPINVYGESKLRGEQILSGYDDHIILRFSLILGRKLEGDHENFITRFISSDDMDVFTDVYRTPVFIGDIPGVIKELIQRDYRGIMNVSGDSYLSYAEMAKMITDCLCIQKNYSEVTCEGANIPKRLGLKNQKLKDLTGQELTGFIEIIKELEGENK